VVDNSTDVIVKRKEFDNCKLFGRLFLIPTVTENPTSHTDKDYKENSSKFKATAERVVEMLAKIVSNYRGEI